MPEITRVQTEADYEAALARIDELIGSVPGSEEDAELDRISDLVIQYEDVHYPMEKPEPAPALEFLLDQQMVSRERMVALAGDGADLDRDTGRRGADTAGLGGVAAGGTGYRGGRPAGNPSAEGARCGIRLKRSGNHSSIGRRQ